jgi:glycerol kinase
VYTAGAAIRWLGEVGLLTDAAHLDETGGSVPDSGGVTFLPALAGLGAPQWRPDARGAFLGLSLGTTRAHLIRAVIDGLAASVALLAGSVAADLGRPLTALRVDGGLTRSRLLLQAQADLLQMPVEVCRIPDATALGVAALARIGTGDAATLDEALGPPEAQAGIEPRPAASPRSPWLFGPCWQRRRDHRAGRGPAGRRDRRRHDRRRRGGRHRDRP